MADIYYIAEKVGGEKFGEFIPLEHLPQKVCQVNRLTITLLVVSTNWDGFGCQITDDSPNFPNFPTIW